MQQKKNRIQKGFTLIELLIVMAIIAMLAALVGPTIIDKLGGAQINTTKAQIEMLSQALDTYRIDVGRYPSGLEGLLQNDSGSPRWSGPYIKKAIPKDPWDQDYHYQAPGSHNNDFDLYSYGPDMQEGGEGENADLVNW